MQGSNDPSYASSKCSYAAGVRRVAQNHRFESSALIWGAGTVELVLTYAKIILKFNMAQSGNLVDNIINWYIGYICIGISSYLRSVASTTGVLHTRALLNPKS